MSKNMDTKLHRSQSSGNIDTDSEYDTPDEFGENDTFYDAVDLNDQSSCELGTHDQSTGVGTKDQQKREEPDKTVSISSKETYEKGTFLHVLSKLQPVEVEVINHIKGSQIFYQDNDWIYVTFHALIAPNIKFNHETDKVYMYIWTEPGMLRTVVEPQFVCYRKDAANAAQIVGSVGFRRRTYYGVVTYKYHIDRKGKTSKGKPRKYIKEEIINKLMHDRRQLIFEYITGNMKESFDQYDGFIYKPRKLQTDIVWPWDKLKGLFLTDNKTDDAQTVTTIFEEDIIAILLDQNFCSKSIADAVRKTHCLVKCVERNYGFTYRKVSTEAIQYVFVGKLQRYINCEEESSVRKKLSIACTFLKLRSIIALPENEQSFEMLLKGFIPTVWKQNVSIELDILNIESNKELRKELQIQLPRLAKTICTRDRSKKSPLWMYLIPIIHFLDGKCKPFQAVPLHVNHNAMIPEWWGQAGHLEQVAYSFKVCIGTAWVKPLTEIINDMNFLPKLDFYLPRTIMASLVFQELKDAIDTRFFPPDVCCAALYYHLKHRNRLEEAQLQKCLESLLDQTSTTDIVMEKNQIKTSIIISIDMLQEALKRQHKGIVITSVKIMLWLLATIDTYDEGNKNRQDEDKQWDLWKISNDICKWINSRTNKRQQLTEYIQVWNTLFATENLPNTRTIKRWKDLMAESFQSQIMKELQERKKTFPQILVQTYCTKLEGCCEIIRDVLTPIVCNALTDVKTIKQSDMSDKEYQALCHIMSIKFVRECENIMQNQGNFDLKTILSWPALPMFLEILYKNKEATHIDGVCKDRVCQIEGVVMFYKQILMTGNIKVNELILMHENKEVFLSLTDILHDDKNIKDVLETRKWELTKYFEIVSALRVLKSICERIESVVVDTKVIDDILETDIDASSLRELVVLSESNAEHKTRRICVLRSKNLPSSVVDVLLLIEKFDDSVCFRSLWKEALRKLTPGSTISLDELIEQVYQPVMERLEGFEKSIQNGSVVYTDIELFVGKFYEDYYEKMSSELSIICLSTNQKLIRKRVEQYKQCRDVIAKAEIAREILEIQRIYKLTGNFQPIKKISQFDIRDSPLSSDKGDIIQASKALGIFSKKKSYCLKIFAKCHELVHWLQESITHDGLRELKVFVDLAMMSAGDDAEKVSRVQSLHACVTGYSSLIFDLQENSDYNRFLQKCDPVFHELENTPHLPDKLEHAKRFLYWFKEIKEAHGAVEVTSFVQAEVINERGIYKIGTSILKTPQDTNQSVFHSTIADLTDIKEILKLTVLVNDSHEVPKEYTYEKLQDLQSRLMLVAGEEESSKKNVERFSLVLDGVVRLCNVYMKLVKSGCVLFQDFAIKLYCDTSPDRPVCAILEFENENIQLKCRKTKDEQLEDVMHKIASAMDNYLTAWLDYVDKNRKKYPELNHFTIEQLVILKKEIAKLNDNKKPTHLIYPVLHIVKNDCKPEDVVKAHHHATSEQETPLEKNEKDEGGEEETSEIDSDKAVFIQALFDAGYQRLAPFALIEFPTFNTSDALCWCMEHEDDIEELEASQQQVTVDETEEGPFLEETVSLDMLILQSIDNTSQFDRCEAMLLKLNEIWNNFLKSVSANMKGFVSLNHLGRFLRHLSRNDENAIRRVLPPGFSDCSPNLIVCAKEAVLYQTLSLYLTDDNQPLPQADEILTCSINTTFEQVDIFLRRAFFNAGGKLHCLMNADLMKLTVCEEVEQRIQQFKRVSDKKYTYRLVIICDSGSENKSIVISSLDKYRKTSDMFDEKTLSERLSLKLKMSEKTGAAVVDFERSTVRVIKSKKSGSGKTLYRRRRDEQLQEHTQSAYSRCVSLPLHEKNINLNYVTGNLLMHVERPHNMNERIIHIDITNQVRFGIDHCLFNLLILGVLVDKSGYVWRKLPTDLYLIETMNVGLRNDCQILNILPSVICRTPQECLDIYTEQKPKGFRDSDQLFDEQEYESDMFKKTYGCLKTKDDTSAVPDSAQHCIETLIKHCGVSNPSWSEIHHFVKFLYRQLLDFEKNAFFSDAAQEILPGFPLFVKRFLIPMSMDFSSRSLNITEESDEVRTDKDTDVLAKYKIIRTWESSPHPYLFFNEDGQTFTFLGFYINNNFDLVDVNTNKVLEEAIMSRELRDALIANKVPIKEDFDKLERKHKIARLCNVIGVEFHNDTIYDKTYELTTDNCKKMMAVYMRLRCDIPVIVMGETGCGKTRLVKFLCELMVPRDVKTYKPIAQNMIIMKVHGGISNEDIKSKVKEAEMKAMANMKVDKNMYTVLFFDEANTTESIGLIKEIICDQSMEGKPLDLCKNLKFVAACNPYRKHPVDLIKKLDKAGLGYHVSSSRTEDTFGKVPMRHLVYRVQPLPHSLTAFVWDFGQLDSFAENLYIRQMVKRYMTEGDMSSSMVGVKLRYDVALLDAISGILSASQEYMRSLKDECSFVSLRDVERTLQVMCWFFDRSTGKRTMFDMAEMKNRKKKVTKRISDETRSLILALGVCYHASLTNRAAYRNYITKHFHEPCQLVGGPDQFLEEINCFEEVFLDSLRLEDNIARNQALMENVFIMVVCIELRIPLFLVGKPGSSKSLAKIVVTDAMQGRAARNSLFKEFKQVQMISFQCSPHSTAAGIVSAFRQCANFQENYKENLDKFVSVVVLDEIGLAEDSPKMPLKTLHPLLEDGCQGDETPQEYMKVAFMGLSNWSLDPAKMNRGLFVQREVPDEKELEVIAKGICSSSKNIDDSLIKPLARAYLKVFNKASEEKREFFGLRDFYSFMKMINNFVKTSKATRPTFHQLRFAVQRNFSGIENFNTFDIFLKEVKYIPIVYQKRKPGDPDDSFPGLIRSWLHDEIESRHLLLLTENYSALPMFEQKFLSEKSVKPIIIFGSSFRRDQEYTQVCRNINRIKLCMETGKLVILLNSDNLYESLYDALNQYYVNFGGERYVDLGLGTHRVKCPVHVNFKLIVVAEKETVYKRFPIPLINRLEKHCLSSSTLLTEGQECLADTLKKWMTEVASESLSVSINQVTEDDLKKIFIGYHEDACSAVAHFLMKDDDAFTNEDLFEKALEEAKGIVIWCATPDAIVRLQSSKREIQNIYFKNQAHDSITDYLEFQFKRKERSHTYSQITTHSTLLTVSHKQALGIASGIEPKNIILLEALSSYDTEQQFNSKIKDHIRHSGKESSLIVIQCPSGDGYVNLIACAKYSVLDECSKNDHVNLLVIVQLTPMETRSFQSLQCGKWHSAHIDSLYSSLFDMPSILSMEGTPLSRLLSNALESTDAIYTHAENEGVMPDRNQDSKPLGLDLKGIIYRCVQRAMSLIRDTEEDVNRATKRIAWVFSILHDTNEKDSSLFVNGITKIVMDIQAIRESPSNKEDKWLAQEAATSASIQKFGTLRRACLQSIENKISPILSAIFAELDTNRNLGILEYDPDSWQMQLWLRLLNANEVKEYMKKIRCVNTQLVVNGCGFGGRTFQTRMPFSWIIIQKFEDLVKQGMLTFGTSEEEGMESVMGLLEGFDLKNSLESVGKEFFNEALESYISDFTEMLYSENKDRHLVALYLKIKAFSMATQKEDTSLVYTLLCVHTTFEKSAQCLKYFRDISSVFDGCSDTLLKRKDNDLLENHELALLALRFLIESVSPESKQLEETFDNYSGREKWLAKVTRYKQVVNQTITFYQSTGYISEQLQKAKNNWNRIVVMQLFIEKVCLRGEEPTTFRCRPLWMQLSTLAEVNFKQIETLQKVEKFLQMCLTRMKNESAKKAEKCKKCGGTHTERSRVLSCTHELCEKCLDEVLTENAEEQKCPICKKCLKADWYTKKVDKETVDRWIEDKVGQYRQRCNFFLMEVVSQLCFAGNTPPDPKVVDWLISCSFQKNTASKADIGVDQSEVFRSYIFKHLVRTDEQELRAHLGKVLTVSDDIGGVTPGQYDDLILTVIHSLEDKMAESVSIRSTEEVALAETCFNQAIVSLESRESVVDQVFAIAQARVGLSVTGTCIHNMLFNKEDIGGNSIKQMDELLQRAKELCFDREYPWKYLLLSITREFGIDVFLAACRCDNVNINWIKKSLQDKVQDTVDNYTACAEKYLKMKQFVLGTLMCTNTQNYLVELKEIPNTVSSVIMFELVVHREIELPRSLREIERSEQHITQLKEIYLELGGGDENCQAIPLAFDHDLVRKMNLDINADHDDREISLKCVVYHWFCVIKHCEATSCSLLKQLFQLAVDPNPAKGYFLPCMPHDMLAALKAVLMDTAKTSQTFAGQETVYFQCENGHPYEVGNCGRPVAVNAKCFCGAPIGGTAYNVLHEKNRPIDKKERTLPGHCLGPPQNREGGAIPERNLSPMQCAFLKFLLHLTMYLGCGNNIQAIRAMIKPEIEEKDVLKYLWNHMLLDIKDLQDVLTFNADEVLLFTHTIIDNIMETSLAKKAADDADGMQSTLSTKEGRDDWEDIFVDTFFKKVLETETRQMLLNRAYEGLQKSSSLFELLNECSNIFPDDRELMDVQRINMNKQVWMPRTPVSLARLRQALQRKITDNKSGSTDFPVLQIFLKKQTELQTVRFLPSILQIHKALLRRYSRNLYKSEAMAITVAQLKHERVAGDDTDVLFEELIKAWNLIRKYLNNSLIRTDKGSRILNVEMSTDVSKMDITDDTSLIYLLPTIEGKGICTYALIDHLIECHNDVIERYRYSERGQKDVGFTTIDPKDITSAHVISFEAQTDLLPIVIANCSVGGIYDFEKIEKMIIERFISTKSRVFKKGHLKIEVMTYRSSLTPASKLEKLDKKITQDPFEMAVKLTICNEIKDVPVISQILSKLDIAINFLDITGGQSDYSLHEFMTDRLKMNKNVLTTKMQQTCSLKHVKALWLSLLLRRCNIMVEQNKPTEMIFEHIEPAYHAPVPIDVEVAYSSYLQNLSKERLFQIIEVVFEFITVVLSESENKEDEDFVDRGQFSLDDCVMVFVEDIDIPGDILCIHALHFWVEASKMYD